MDFTITLVCVYNDTSQFNALLNRSLQNLGWGGVIQRS